ncbi:amidohydrolase family protein [Membranihabitans marinus]|uniref:amidohydrolase family protein n=1 Tax=Membranihabitans marinus TaxID=1227546 RepID=UPI001F299481|nr:hypothetical protein [Membranihabitans marinus]
MLIDSNAYIGHWPFRERNYNTCDGLMTRMDEFGVDMSYVSSLTAIMYKNTQTANASLYREIQGNSEAKRRLKPVAVINPIYGYGGWKDDYYTCIKEWEMSAIKIFPIYHRYDFNNEYCIELVRMAAKDDIPVMIPIRMVDARPSSWLDVEESLSTNQIMGLVKQVPETKYILQNVASGVSFSDENEKVFRNNQVWMDTSGRSMNEFHHLVERFGVEKFVFGTHSPTLDYVTGLLRIESLYNSEANEADKESIRATNIQKIFNHQ